EADDLAAVRRLKGVGNWPKPGQHQVLHHHGHADRGDQREKLIALVSERRENRGIDTPSKGPAHREGNRNAQDVTAANEMHEKVGGEGAERDKIGVREIDLHEHAVDQRQAERHQNVETSEYDAVDRLLQDDRCCHRRISSTSGWSTTCPAWSPCNGWCP